MQLVFGNEHYGFDTTPYENELTPKKLAEIFMAEESNIYKFRMTVAPNGRKEIPIDEWFGITGNMVDGVWQVNYHGNVPDTLIKGFDHFYVDCDIYNNYEISISVRV